MLNKGKTGLVFGIFLGFIHLVRAVVIAITPAGMQKFLDRIFGLHFLEPVYILTQATRGKGILLILITFAMGYLMGVVFAYLRNRLLGHKEIIIKGEEKPLVKAKPAVKTKAKKRK